LVRRGITSSPEEIRKLGLVTFEILLVRRENIGCSVWNFRKFHQPFRKVIIVSMLCPAAASVLPLIFVSPIAGIMGAPHNIGLGEEHFAKLRLFIVSAVGG
jgi:hypothetical protein